MTEKTVVIIANGEELNPDLCRAIVSKDNIIIAADGGAVACQNAKIFPHYIIGDLDSVTEDLQHFFSGSEIIHLTDQYSTDMEKALKLASSLSPHKVKILSALGKRSDHANANLLFLQEYNDKIPVEIYDNYGKLTVLKPGKHQFELEIGRTISFFSFGPVGNLSLRGFRYNLANENYANYFVGNSNVVESKTCEIEFKRGRIFMYLINSLRQYE